MPKNLLVSITAYINRVITCYEHERGKRGMSIGKDLGRSIIGASGLQLGPSDQGKPQSEKDLGEIEVSEW